MGNKADNIITIDLLIWTTMAKKAAELKLSESAIRQRVHRSRKGTAKDGTKEDYLDIPELDLTLVRKP